MNSNEYKSIVIACVFVAGVVVGCIMTVIIYGVDARMGPSRHVHQFGFWTNNMTVYTLGGRWQERYCTNCGYYQGEVH